MDVDLYADPGCAWSWAAYRWLDAVAPRRQLRPRLRPFSLLLRDGTAGLPDHLAAKRRQCHAALRVAAAIDDEDARWAFHGALCTPIFAALARGEAPLVDLAGALGSAGVPADVAEAADDPEIDAVIGESMAEVGKLLPSAGAVQRIPVLVLHEDGGPLAIRGPLLDPEPRGHEAVQLWDAVHRVVTMPTVYEISRPRPERHSFTIAS